jgi:hypothetical protein
MTFWCVGERQTDIVLMYSIGKICRRKYHFQKVEELNLSRIEFVWIEFPVPESQAHYEVASVYLLYYSPSSESMIFTLAYLNVHKLT